MEMNQITAGAPHRKGMLTTGKIMQYMILSLLPAGVYGIWNFGANAALVILLTCGSAVLTEFLFEKFTGKPIGIKNYRTLLAGLLMAYSLPAGAPWYVAVTAGCLCALIMQISFHFFYRNVVSPVILARLILMLAFSAEMSSYVFEGLTMATPLTVLKGGGVVNTLSMIVGRTGGCIGETSVLFLCLGAIFLIFMGLMDFRVSGMYLFSFAAFMAVFGGEGLSSYYLTAQLAGGGFMLALWYVSQDYSTLPITKGGRWIYGILLGILTGVFRLFGNSAENLCFAILIANLCVPFIEKMTIRRPFGVEKGEL